MKKGYRIAPEIKDQILKRVREEGTPIAQVAQEHGISDRTIYGWLTKGISEAPSLGELVRAKRQNEELELIRQQKHTRKELAFRLGVSVSSLYYQSKKIVRDWELNKHPAYGYRRVAIELKINRKKAQRIMKLFGLKAYRRRGRK